MKRILSLALAFTMVVLLSGCAQSEAAKALDEQILAIGEVTDDSLEAIEAAEQIYNSMEAKEQKQVKKRKVLFKARDIYSQLQADKVIAIIDDLGEITLESGKEIEDAEKAKDSLSEKEQMLVRNSDILVAARSTYSQLQASKVDDLIASIGEVTINSYDAISKAERSFKALTDEERALVSRSADLEAARAAYDAAKVKAVEQKISDALSDASKVNAADSAYNALSDELKKEVSNYDKLVQKKADLVISAIDAIGEVSLDSEELIKAAETAYKALKSDEQKLVANYQVLKNARDRLNELKREQQEKKKAELISKMNVKSDEVKGTTWYVSKSQPKYINSRSYMLPYVAHLTGLSSIPVMRIKYVYAGRDWIFFKKATIVTDEYRYTRTFNYFDVERETSFGANLCEYVDVLAENKDIDMLRDVASSQKAIVRLEGDSHYKDITLSASDKQAIQDMLDLYDILDEFEIASST